MVTPAEHPVPQAIDAEKSVIGAMLIAPKAVTEARELLTAGDFYREQHRLLFDVMCRMVDTGKPVDAVTVAAELLAVGKIRQVGGHPYLHTLMAEVPTASNVAYYADEVRKTARRRRVIEACTRAIQAAASPSDDDAFLDVTAASALALDLVVDEKPANEPIPDLVTWRQYIEQNTGQQAPPAVVPGLINQADVWMILAPPGAGKTTLSRQVCHCVAAGIHPFDWGHKITPKRTLMIDLEVDPATGAEESSGPLAQVERMGDYEDDRAWIWPHVQGLNLRRREDQQMFERVIERTRPDLVVLGSLYKTGVQAKGGESYEVAANEVRDFLDRMRRRWRFALWIEHHMPKAADGGRKPNPFGSSTWEWWPSHGRVLERAAPAASGPFRFSAPFRGDRGVRRVPVGFQRGGKLPWTPIWDEAELELCIEAAGGTP